MDAARLRSLGTAPLTDGGASAIPGVAAMWPGASVAGPAVTARVPAGDNLAIQVAVADAPAGSVVVVEVVGDAPCGYWGEVLTVAAQARGLVGAVIAGAIRDLAPTRDRGFPVFATGSSPIGPAKRGAGSVNMAVTLGGTSVYPGDWVVGDDDGVVVIASDRLDDVTSTAQAKVAREPAMFERLLAGATTIELLGLDVASITRE